VLLPIGRILKKLSVETTAGAAILIPTAGMIVPPVDTRIMPDIVAFEDVPVVAPTIAVADVAAAVLICGEAIPDALAA
jgi:hypothetical protein